MPIKVRVDDDPRPGQYLLTGSARLLGLRALPDALVGRKETIELWPFSQAEIGGQFNRFIDRLFDHELPAAESNGLGSCERDEYFDRVERGGFPEALQRDGRRRTRFFSSYVEDLVDRDVTQLGEIERRQQLMRLLRLLAAGAGQIFVADRYASQLGIAAKTVERYVSLFEEVFLMKRVPAWSGSATNRAIRARKLMFVDSGLATNLTGRSASRLSRGDELTGSHLENFVISELARLMPHADADVRLFHYRTRDGVEVDAVIERSDGTIAGLEVKAADSVRADDLRGLCTSAIGPDRTLLPVPCCTPGRSSDPSETGSGQSRSMRCGPSSADGRACTRLMRTRQLALTRLRSSKPGAALRC